MRIAHHVFFPGPLLDPATAGAHGGTAALAPARRLRAAVFCATSIPGAKDRAPNGKMYDLKMIASTARVARDRGVIKADAWSKDLHLYRTNPVVQWAHDYNLPPIAVSVDVEVDQQRGNLVEYWRFLKGLTDDEWDRFAGRIAALYAVGGMRAASVGWNTREYRDAKGEDRDEAVKLGDDREPLWVITRAELLETSAVPVPADPHALAVDRALREMAAKKVDHDQLAEFWKHLKDNGAEHPGLIDAGTKAMPTMLDRIQAALEEPKFQIPVSWLDAYREDAEPEKVDGEAQADADADAHAVQFQCEACGHTQAMKGPCEACGGITKVVTGTNADDGEHAAKYKCEACGHTQMQAGACEECGSDQMTPLGGESAADTTTTETPAQATAAAEGEQTDDTGTDGGAATGDDVADGERPFGEYDNFADCVAKNQDKDDPKAYCAVIKAKIEGKKAQDADDLDTLLRKWEGDTETECKRAADEDAAALADLLGDQSVRAQDTTLADLALLSDDDLRAATLAGIREAMGLPPRSATE